MRKSIYNISERNGKKLKNPFTAVIEQTEDGCWKASSGTASAISKDRNECLQKLIKELEVPKAVTKEQK